MADNESLKAQIKLELIEVVESRIQNRYESDRSFIREIIGAAIKILAVALTIVAVILTLFGIKTISDINDVILKTTRKEINNRLNMSNPTVKYAAEVEALYNKVLINDIDLRIRSNTLISKSIRVSDEEVERIIAALERPEMQSDTFGTGVDVLTRTATQDQWERVSKRFRSMVSAKDQYQWLAESDDKRKAIIHGLHDRADNQSINAIRGIATNKNATTSLRSAAIEFVGVMGDYESVPILESLAVESNSILERAVVLALAKIRPSSATLTKWIENIKSDSDVNYLSNAFELIKSLEEGISKDIAIIPPAGDRQVAATLVIKIFEHLANSGVALRFQPERSEETYSTLLVAYRPAHKWSYFPIPASSVFSEESSQALNEILKSAVSADDKIKIRNIVSFLTIDWGETAHVGAAVYVTLTKNARI